jgi:transposase-like protein
MPVFAKPYFHEEDAAVQFVERILWPHGPVCPGCGGAEPIYAIKPNPLQRVRYGLKQCGRCRMQFTVRIGTLFESSKVPMTKWLQAILLCAGKTRVSGQQLHRILETNYKTGWLLAHRIRAATRPGEGAPKLVRANRIGKSKSPVQTAQPPGAAGEAADARTIEQQGGADQPSRLQADKFREFARQLPCDEDEKAFEATVRKVAAPPARADPARGKRSS